MAWVYVLSVAWLFTHTHEYIDILYLSLYVYALDMYVL